MRDYRYKNVAGQISNSKYFVIWKKLTSKTLKKIECNVTYLVGKNFLKIHQNLFQKILNRFPEWQICKNGSLNIIDN